jgi:hypothetical protein
MVATTSSKAVRVSFHFDVQVPFELTSPHSLQARGMAREATSSVSIECPGKAAGQAVADEARHAWCSGQRRCCSP